MMEDPEGPDRLRSEFRIAPGTDSNGAFRVVAERVDTRSPHAATRDSEDEPTVRPLGEPPRFSRRPF